MSFHQFTFISKHSSVLSLNLTETIIVVFINKDTPEEWANLKFMNITLYWMSFPGYMCNEEKQIHHKILLTGIV